MEKLQVLIGRVLGRLNEKQRLVIERRYGLKNGTPSTLESIGKELKLTRERIRQIQNAAFATLNADEVKSVFRPMMDATLTQLAALGGVRQENIFFDELIHLIDEEGSKREAVNRALDFIFQLYGSPKRLAEDRKFYAARYARDSDLSKAKELIVALERISKQIGQPMDADGFQGRLASGMKLSRLENEATAIYYLGISKKFKLNPYGDFGLHTWQEISPKSMRDKAYLVMKKTGKPLHFSEINNAINTMKFDSRVAYPQTVHNELIKDKRMVLCGRGMYGLREWGIEPGTVKELMVRILKREGALGAEDLVRLVKTQRHVKDSTILIGLQDKKSFRRLDDGRYRIRIA